MMFIQKQSFCLPIKKLSTKDIVTRIAILVVYFVQMGWKNYGQ